MPNCTACDSTLDASEFNFTPANQQTQPGKTLLEYTTTCDSCGETLSGSSYISIQFD